MSRSVVGSGVHGHQMGAFFGFQPSIDPRVIDISCYSCQRLPWSRQPVQRRVRMAAGDGWRTPWPSRRIPMTDSQPARRTRRWRLLKWLFVWLPLIVIVGSSAQVLILRWVPPVTSAIMIGREVDAVLAGHWRFRLQYHWRAWERISPNLPISLVAAEDQKFPFHDGFDFEAMTRPGRQLRAVAARRQ